MLIARTPTGEASTRSGGMFRPSWPWLFAFWLASYALLTALVHLRALRALDTAALGLLASTRPDSALEAMNWVFRLGFVQVDVAIAVIWSGVVLWNRLRPSRHRAPLNLRALLDVCWPAAAPLLILGLIGVQAGMRLVVEQPAPGPGFAVHRPFATQPVADVLDKTDAVARESFLQATAQAAATAAQPAERGSYPSGHSSRILFLAGLALAWYLPGASTRIASLGGRTRPILVKALVAATAVLTVVAVSYSAMYFGYHWPTDIFGGLLLAMAFLPPALYCARR